MAPKAPTQRRNLLISLASVGFVGLTGCASLGDEDDDVSGNSPTIVDGIEIVNGWDAPRTFTIVVRSVEDALYWDARDLDARNGDDETATVVEGPIGSGDEPLWLDVTVDDPSDGPITAEDGTVVSHPLGDENDGCVYVTVVARISGGLSVSVEPAEDTPSRETRC